MNDKIVALDPPESDEALRKRLIEALEGYLDLAKRGELASIVVVAMKPNHKFTVRWVGLLRAFEVMGMLAQAISDIAISDWKENL